MHKNNGYKIDIGDPCMYSYIIFMELNPNYYRDPIKEN
jgi:hypothetical protein